MKLVEKARHTAHGKIAVFGSAQGTRQHGNHTATRQPHGKLSYSCLDHSGNSNCFERSSFFSGLRKMTGVPKGKN